jgi:hypothetical protein
MLFAQQEFDWIPYSQRDIDSILNALKTFNSAIFSDDAVRKIRKTITPLIREHFDHLIERDVTNRIPPEIFVPGHVIFSEIDVKRRIVEGIGIVSSHVFMECMNSASSS